MLMKKSILMTLIGFLAIGSIYAAKSPTYIPWKNGKLCVSKEHRYLKHENGKPFFGLAIEYLCIPSYTYPSRPPNNLF